MHFGKCQLDMACRETVLFSRRFRVDTELDGRVGVRMMVNEGLHQAGQCSVGRDEVSFFIICWHRSIQRST